MIKINATEPDNHDFAGPREGEGRRLIALQVLLKEKAVRGESERGGRQVGVKKNRECSKNVENVQKRLSPN